MGDISILQLFLQLGAIGAVLFVVNRLGGKWIDRWSEQETAKNAQLGRGFEAITNSINTFSAADIASHERLIEAHGELRDAVVRMDAKLDTLADFAPRDRKAS
jgi:hypothetical protein